MCPARLRTADPEHLVLPVEIVQAQAADFACSQSVSDEQHQNRAVALVDRPVAFRRGQEAQDILPLQPLRHVFVPLETWRHDPLGHARRAPAARFGKPKERAKTLSVIVHRSAVAGSPRFFGRDGVVDVGDPDRGQRNIALRPASRRSDRRPRSNSRIVASDSPRVAAHPCFIGVNFGAMGMAHLRGFIEPAEKTQPLDRVADEASSCLG